MLFQADERKVRRNYGDDGGAFPANEGTAVVTQSTVRGCPR